MGKSKWCRLIPVLLIVVLMASGIFACAPMPKPEETPTPTQAPAPEETLTPSPTLPAEPTLPPEKIGSTVTEPDMAKETDMWASYLEGEAIQAIAVDKDCFWLGTDSGLLRFSKKGNQISVTRYTEVDGLLGSDVQAVKVYKGEVWIGTRDGGLSRFDGSQFTNYGKEQGLFDPRVMALDVDEESVWLGLCFGLSRFDKRTEKFRNRELPGGYAPGVGSGSGEGAGEDPRRIYCDSILFDGEYIWHAAFNGFRSNPELTNSELIACGALPDSRVTSICKDENYIYFGTIRGLSRIDLTTVDRPPLKFRFFGWEEGLSSDSISALVRDGKYLWIGTDKGIDRFNTEGLEIGCYEGYTGSSVISLAADGSYIWIGTLNGLFRLNERAEPNRIVEAGEVVVKGIRTVGLAGPLLADFEGETGLPVRVPYSEVVEVKATRISTYLDEGANGTSSSLRVELELLSAQDVNVSIMDCFIGGDMTPYEGMTFFIKVESEAAEIGALVVFLTENGPHWRRGAQAVEEYDVHIPQPKEWTRIVIPFTAFKLHADGARGVVNRILDLPKVNFLNWLVCLSDCQAGDRVKIWLDEIRFYKKGEFEPTVPDQGTPINRQK